MNPQDGGLLVCVDYKGKRYKKYFKLEGSDEKYVKNLKKVYILIIDKQNKNNYNYHFICVVGNGYVIIPSTSIMPKETGWIYLNFKEHVFNIPIHAIPLLGHNIPTSLDLNIYL